MTTQQKTAAEWQKTIDQLKAQLTEAQRSTAAAEAARDSVALAAHSGDVAAKEQLAEAHKELTAARLDCESLAAAIAAAEAEKRKAEKVERAAEAEARMKSARAVAKKRIKAAEAVEQAATALAAAIDAYNKEGSEFYRFIQNNQAQSRWRLDSFLNHSLGLGHVPPAMRRSLVEMERQTMESLTQ